MKQKLRTDVVNYLEIRKPWHGFVVNQKIDCNLLSSI